MSRKQNTKHNYEGLLSVQLQAYQTPDIVEHKNKDVVFFGKDNDFSFKLIDFYNESPTHNAIVNGKVGYICGEGFSYEDPSQQKENQVAEFLNKANKHESWNQITKKIVLDYEIHNGYAIEVLRQKSGALEFFHLDFAKICRTMDDNILKYSDKWTTEKRVDGKVERKSNSKPEAIELPLFDKDSDEERSVIYHADYRPNMEYYPLPVYQGSLAAIETDLEINNWWVNEIKNGFSSGTLLTFNNGIPEPDKKKEIEKKFKGKTAGSQKAGEILINFAVDQEHAPTIDSLNGNDLDKRYDQMSKAVQQNIFTGHRVTSPMLFGVKTEGQLGGRSELQTADELFKNTYVSERQQTILRTINKTMKIVLGFSGVTIKDFEPVESKLELSEATVAANLNREEIRQLISRQTGLELKSDKEFSKFAKTADDNEEAIIAAFEASGENVEHYEVLAELDIEFGNSGEPLDVKFKEDLKELDKEILALIGSNEKMTKAEIAKALDVTILEVTNAIKALQKDKLVGKSDGFDWNLLKAGIAALKVLDLPDEKKDLKIKYQYQLRPDAPAISKGGSSRPFCRALMSMNKIWSREQIDLMRNDMSSSGIAPEVTNVWLSRGGWYNDPTKSAATPFCRHIWKQIIVREKK